VIDRVIAPSADAHVAAARAGGADVEHEEDLRLAWAAACGEASALRWIEALLAELGPAVRRVDPSPAFADEVRQATRVRLLVGDGSAPRIAGYGGRGPLRAWLQVAAARIALDLKRGRRAVPDRDDVLGELVTREPDPELRLLKQQYRAEFREALTAALAALPERARAVLRLHHVDGLRLAEIGRLYQVHESTASRWVAQAAETVADDARARLVARLSLSPSNVDSVARLVRSQLDLSIARLLGA
jgi:RNA polymerase sigma-70 factor (ECF subfamily)